MIKTLIVDDSSLVRAVLRDFLESDDSFRVVGEAGDGLEAVGMAQRLGPDLITMDIEMPVMNGLDAIGEIRKTIETAIVVITTANTARMTYKATVKGALEVFPKDAFAPPMDARKREEVLGTLKSLAGIKKRIPAAPRPRGGPGGGRKVEAVAIAASTGGPKALNLLCAALPEGFPVPIILVQHNSPGFDRGFAHWLGECGPLGAALAEEGEAPAAGNIYVAPTDRHLKIGPAGFFFDDGEPVNNQRPAADEMFKSAAELYGGGLVSVVLTGMGRDGADGTRFVKQAGGTTIAQDEASSLVYGMPQAAAETGCVDMVLPLGEIAGRLSALAGRGRA